MPIPASERSGANANAQRAVTRPWLMVIHGAAHAYNLQIEWRLTLLILKC